VHETCDKFEGKTFAEVILDLEYNGTRLTVFRHFKRTWHQDPSVTRWGISVRNENISEAKELLEKIKNILADRYSIESVQRFFTDKEIPSAYPTKDTQTNDDDWFKDDYFDKMIKTGVLQDDFIQFLNDKDVDNDKDSVKSWGTGDTTYTEIMASIPAQVPTDTSTITPDSVDILSKEVDDRKERFKEQLLENGIPEKDIHKIMASDPPYDMIMGNITRSSWNAETSMVMIMAIREHYFKKEKHKNDERQKQA
jgi:hypothetical protein